MEVMWHQVLQTWRETQPHCVRLSCATGDSRWNFTGAGSGVRKRNPTRRCAQQRLTARGIPAVRREIDDQNGPRFQFLAGHALDEAREFSAG